MQLTTSKGPDTQTQPCLKDRAARLNIMSPLNDYIFTPRLKIRRYTIDDLHQLVTWNNDKNAYGKHLTPDNTSEESYREKLETGVFWTEKNKCFMIEIKDGEPIGTLHYWLRPEREDCAVMQIKVAQPDQRGKGYGTEAQKYLIINLFNRAKVAEVEMYTDVNNGPQQRCLAKLGFESIDSLSYEDHSVSRLGYLYRLTQQRFTNYPVYHYHYE